MKRLFTSGLMVASLFGLGVEPALALECPMAHDTGRPGAIKETPKTVAQLSTVLGQEGERAAPRVIHDLRERHPAASKGAIMNYLITAYCPAVNSRSDLTEAQKKAKLESFQRAVTGQLYASRG